jgi:short-subunit dehydrogenase
MVSHGRGQVTVTGASTGIGHATALHLHDIGFSVLAAVRRDEDARRLAQRGVTPVHLDVTSAEQLAAVRAELDGTPLAGIVNNAAISSFGPLELMTTAELRETFDVNVVAPVAVIQAFIDPLRAGNGRIVNVGSVAGRFARPLAGAYDASKFAVRAINDSLRRELAPKGVDVTLIEPGTVNTAFIGKVEERLHGLAGDESSRRYGAMIAKLVGDAEKIRHGGMEAGAVAKVIGRALTARRPRTYYRVGRDAHLLGTKAGLLPDRVMDRILLHGMTA